MTWLKKQAVFCKLALSVTDLPNKQWPDLSVDDLAEEASCVL